MNIIKLNQGDIVLDNMTGSGTTNVEASILGIDSIGIDASPFCCLMAQAKVDALGFNSEVLKENAKESNEIFERYQLAHSSGLSGYMDTGRTSKPPEQTSYDNFLKLCYLDAMGYAKRRKGKNIEQLFPIVLDKYVSAVSNFAAIRDKNNIKLGKATIARGDARDLNSIHSKNLDGIRDESVDGIITSPPYSFAIDYLEGDKLQLEYMGFETEKLKEKMIGLRGRTIIDKIANYLKDMNETVREMSRALKRGRYCVIVVGSNAAQLQKAIEANGNGKKVKLEFLDENGRLEDTIKTISERNGLWLVKRLSRPIEGVKNVMRSEEILILKKK
jgi:tRNA G10  N-methylase Trm11